jgi:predicted ester cyclase
VEGDLAAVRLTMSGTHEGEFMGLAPTGRRMEIGAMDLIRVRDGQAVEHWGVTDTMTMMQQLGAIPEEAPSG